MKTAYSSSRWLFIAGFLLLGAAPTLFAGYRVYYQKTSSGAPPPVDRSIGAGWVLANLNGTGRCLLEDLPCSTDADCVSISSQPHDKCSVPFDTVADITFTCESDEDVYLAISLLTEGGFETAYLSANSEVYRCGTCDSGDADGDGSCAEPETGAPADCDDQDSRVRPGGSQVCDGVNNDCQHPTWPDLEGTNEVDQDGDGFSACAGDCDDAVATVFPGAPQACDRINNDCSDAQWPVPPSAEVDADADGFSPCEGDLEDSNSSIFPSSPVVVNGQETQPAPNGPDQSEPGSPLGDPLAPEQGPPIVEPTAWVVNGVQSNERMGHSVAGGGDINGDGYADVLVGAVNYANGQVDEGRVLVFHGSPTGLSAAATYQLEGQAQGGLFGSAVAFAGDVNNDGFDDTIISSRLFSGGQALEGRVSVYLGSLSGLAQTPSWTKEADQAGARLEFVASAGDVNGDGFDDIIIGTPLWDNGTAPENQDVGHAWVYYGSGSPSGVSATPAREYNGSQPGSGLGNSVASAGDVNGDGYSDIIIGEYHYTVSGQTVGRVVAFLGSAGGLSSTPNWTAVGSSAGAFGLDVNAAGDVDGDGFDDVVVGSGEAAFVFYGSADGLLNQSDPKNSFVPGGQTASQFGNSVAGAGDVNADGFDDVIIGAFLYDDPEMSEGAAFVYLGSADGLVATPAWTTESNQSSAL